MPEAILEWNAISAWNVRHEPLDTPLVVVDLDVAERNIARAQSICDKVGVACRPHIKTHKSVVLARRQLEQGASGITCQKLGEAEAMAEAGFQDILISYNIVGAAKHGRLRNLHDRISLLVSCDSVTVARGLGQAVQTSGKALRVLVECDTGRHRCGVPSPEAAADLARSIQALPGLAFAGLLIYPPNGKCADAANFVSETRRLCAADGLDLEIVSSGGTPNLAQVGLSGETEFRPGTYIYNDRQMVAQQAARPEDCALFIYSTVVSRPEPGRMMLDAGSKTLSSDLAGFDDFGYFPDYPDARLYRFAEEHGFVDVSACPRVPEVGEVVRILPNHVCATVNLHDRVATVRNCIVSGSLSIDARGRIA